MQYGSLVRFVFNQTNHTLAYTSSKGRSPDIFVDREAALGLQAAGSAA